MTQNQPKELLFENFDFIESQCALATLKLFRTTKEVAADHNKDDLFLLVIEQLSQDNYEILTRYPDPNRVKGFLKVFIHRKAIDFQRKKLGRSEITKVIEEIGPPAKKVFAYYITHPMPIEDVTEIINRDDKKKYTQSQILEIGEKLKAAAEKMQLRSAAREKTVEMDASFYEPTSQSPTPDDAIIETEDAGHLKDLLGALTPVEAHALALRFQDDLKPREMALVLIMSEKAVSNLIYRALAKCKQAALEKGFSLGDFI
ncbi:MAG: sigma-70 family RNA polymerase sigma factor [SAR324 cluster bacterium]|nr:sigma-70 family RNA polymerase sigma factor [SAR324 cluster bacterium]